VKTTILVSMIMMMVSVAHAAGVPVETLVPVERIYVPKGFDSNDSAEVIISGYLPNLCHKSPMTKVTVKGSTLEIKVSSLKYDKTNPFCPEMVVPFIERVNLGILKNGTYKIEVNKDSKYKKVSEISIDKAEESKIDNFIYANVHNILSKPGSRSVVLKGYTPSDCLVLDEIRFISNGVDTYSVLPIMKQVNDFCPMKMVPFTYTAKMPEELNGKSLLLHVRVMNGKSVNSLYYK
jgi:hypothetical protein